MSTVLRRKVALVSDKPFVSANGYLMFTVGLALLLIPLANFFLSWGSSDFVALLGKRSVYSFIAVVLGVFILKGLYTVEPNQAVVLMLFGAYKGTDRSAGLRWVNPFLSKTRVTERSQNFVTQQLKVNDKNGNPIEIAAAVVWRVQDAALATLGVEDYSQFVIVQSESAVRHLASEFAYDHGADETSKAVTLRGGGQVIADVLEKELSTRLQSAGIEVIDTKLTHLAYAPEIAGAMLRRQQAEAVLSARRIIVEGAVGMVEMALLRLSEKKIVELDDERRAAMVSNLMVVLCSEKDVTPIINSGTLYQ